MKIYDEEKLQLNIINFFKNMGYTFISQNENIKFRNSLNEVILKDILKTQLIKLNSFEYKSESYKFSDKNINQAINDLNVNLHEGLAKANSKITDMLLFGNAYEETLKDGSKKSFSIKYIDLKNPLNNSFHITEEFSTDRIDKLSKIKTRRIDLVLFINGLPLGAIELKKSSVNAKEGVLQLIQNQKRDEIPHFFKYSQILVGGNSHNPKYGTTNTPFKFYSIWEEELNLSELIVDREVTKLDKTLFSLFKQERFIEIIDSFILFDSNIKKIARYQQYFAIKETVAKITKLNANLKREGGLIWHTQGSGKSLTMVMLTKLIKREILNSKVIVVTDRIDLDKQIEKTFNHSETKAYRATSGANLITLLKEGKSVITTVINKFVKAKDEEISLKDRDIFILVDESHRTQSGDLHKAMKKVFPNGCYIGFSGTPLMKREKNSFQKFGGLIHKYTIDEAVRDKAVLPLLYEGRLVNQWINDKSGLDRRFEFISKHLSEKEKIDLTKKWAKFAKVASSERRLESIVFDINRHFRENFLNTGFNAMLATSSKYEAIKYHKLFCEYGDLKSAFIISAPELKEGSEEVDESESAKSFILNEWQKIIRDYSDYQEYEDKIKEKFIAGEIDLLIVVDKLLTGFDAPRASVLYIDKELKEHSLLQAIARVNRLYEAKEFGYIIDYRGLLGNLDEALNTYQSLSGFEEEDLIGAVIDIKSEIAKVKTYYSYLQELFKEIKHKSDMESYEIFLSEPLKRENFYEYLKNYTKALKLALSSDKIEEVLSETEIREYRAKMKFYYELRQAIRVRYHEAIDFKEYEKQMQKLLDNFISADDEINHLTKLVNIFESDFDKEISRVIGDRARADTIKSALSAIIKEKFEENPIYYEKLSKKIEETLQKYMDKRISEREYYETLKSFRDEVVNESSNKSYPKEINSKVKIAIYDNLKEICVNECKNDLIKLTLLFDNIFKDVSKKPDWDRNVDMRHKIDSQIDEILWDIQDKYKIEFETEPILEVINMIGIANYAK